MFLIDSHCHLHNLTCRKEKNGINNIIKRANKKYVKMILVVSTSIKDYYVSQTCITKNPNILYSCGIHPNNIKNYKHNIKKLKDITMNKNVAAIGETGLDYLYSLKTASIQKLLFREHIKVAKKLKKPIIIHCRKAIHDVLHILKEENNQPYKGIIHSCTEDSNTVKKLIDLGFYISFSGIVTFKNASLLRNVVKTVPVEKILIETDSPYLSPEPYRGKENEPSYLYEIAKFIAKLKKINVETLAKKTKKNFFKLFNLSTNKKNTNFN
ncbi:TatD family hydrolase [Buchnera aphidicola (Mindarus keteleerifoliae)]|uniref:TatD family hydrolase n=1 Tax=Buchnera aphidicola TaxID=9 RepID=UPI0031B6F5D5